MHQHLARLCENDNLQTLKRDAYLLCETPIGQWPELLLDMPLSPHWPGSSFGNGLRGGQSGRQKSWIFIYEACSSHSVFIEVIACLIYCMYVQTCKTLSYATLVLNMSKFSCWKEHTNTIVLKCSRICIFFFHSQILKILKSSNRNKGGWVVVKALRSFMHIVVYLNAYLCIYRTRHSKMRTDADTHTHTFILLKLHIKSGDYTRNRTQISWCKIFCCSH